MKKESAESEDSDKEVFDIVLVRFEINHYYEFIIRSQCLKKS